MYLFVYGTLRKEYNLSLMHQLADRIEYVGQGRTKAVLFDLGAYPAAVADEEEESEITGDLFQITDGSVLGLLDDYEGEEYRRALTLVKLESGEEKEAFIYWYHGPTNHATRIDDGDYLRYLKNKKDRFL